MPTTPADVYRRSMRIRALSFLAGLAAVATTPPAHAQTPSDMEPLTWMAVPNSDMRQVQADPELYADLQGNGFPNIMLAWGGGVLDGQRLRMIIWGGGHNDYYGNEIYAFDIATLQWERLNEPTVDWNDCGDPNADGTANARHTYRSMAFMDHADRMFVSGGALNCTSGSCGGQITWELDFDALTWTDRQPSGDHSTGCENVAEYDPVSQTVYFGDAGGLYGYDYDTNAWTQLNSDYIYAAAVAVDTTRGTLLMLGEGEVWSYDIGQGDYTRQDWATTGGDAFIAGTAQGLAYDPTTDRYVGWGGDTIYALDPTTQVWTTYDVPGAPEDLDGLRVWGRWRYVPGVNAFILVTDVDTDVHFFKFSEGGEIPDPGDDDDDDDDDATTGDGGSDGAPGEGDDGVGDGADTAPTSDNGGDTRGAPGTGSGGTDGGAPGADEADGCACRASGEQRPLLGLGLLALVGLGHRRRRSARVRPLNR